MGEISLASEAFQALANLLDPARMAYLFVGVLIGLAFGTIPGLSGLVGLSLLLPFTFNMDPYTALAFLIGLQAVVATSDTIPAVLFGVPGTVGAAATVMDGYPMARSGKAGRAFGAAFSASVIGGLWGAALLALCIPILRPVMLYVGTPEMAAVCVFGLSLAAVLSGRSLLKGLVVACIGLMLSTIGEDAQTGTLRWSESIYVWAGLPIVPLALGLFAIPEIADLVIQRSTISRAHDTMSATGGGKLQGLRDVLRSWFLVLRCSTLGAVLGAVPGIGASVLDWIAYGHAARSEKGASESFGKGDVRGVIAAESANNAKEGGALVPTIAFGVPGSASMALILGALLAQGIVPGPDMLSARLDVTYTMVWSVAIANILGAGILFLFARQIAKVALVRIGILAPTVLALVFVGAFQGSQQWGDLYTLLGFGFIGFAMKRLGWPRPPLILGFILGGLIERYVFISVERFGGAWLWERPIVIGLILLTLLGILIPLFSKRRNTPKASKNVAWRFHRGRIDADFFFALVLMGLFALSLFVSAQWEFGAKLMPQIVATVAILLLGAHITATVFLFEPRPAESSQKSAKTHFDIASDFGELSPGEITRRAGAYFAWLLFLLALTMIIGLLPGIFVFLVLYLRFAADETWSKTMGIAIGLWVPIYILFHRILFIPWPQSMLGDWFPGLRSIAWISLF
jgi:TctA family transporter